MTLSPALAIVLHTIYSSSPLPVWLLYVGPSLYYQCLSSNTDTKHVHNLIDEELWIYM